MFKEAALVQEEVKGGFFALGNQTHDNSLGQEVKMWFRHRLGTLCRGLTEMLLCAQFGAAGDLSWIAALQADKRAEQRACTTANWVGKVRGVALPQVGTR